jgi:hypothetical protein
MRNAIAIPLAVFALCLAVPLGGIAVAAADASAFGGVSGTVTNAQGTGVPGVRVWAFTSAGTSWWSRWNVVTDGSGKYAIRILPGGIYRLYFADEGGANVSAWYRGAFRSADAENVTVAEGLTVPGVDMQLAPAGRVSGRVSDAKGRGVAGLYVTVYVRHGDRWYPVWRVNKPWETDSSGRYSVGGVAGSCRVGFGETEEGEPDIWYDNATSWESTSEVVVSAGNTVEDVDGVVGPFLPPGEFVINGGAAYTNAAEVTLSWVNLSASKTRFSAGTLMPAWTPFLTATSFALPAGDGNKTVVGQYRSSAGVGAPRTSVEIILDTVPPSTVVSGVPAGSSSTPVTATLTATDATSGVASTEYRLQGATGWTPYAAPFVLGAQGTFVYEYRSSDRAGNVEASKAFTVSIALSPAIARLSPTSAKRGATVTISGTNFGAARGTSAVRFGGTACTKYVAWSDTRIACKVPAKARLGTVKVTVTTAGGVSNARSFRVKR